MEQFPQFRKKSPEELEKQLNKAESFFGNKIEPNNVREKLLSLSLDELKNSYPEEYQSYISFLKEDAFINSFPDIDKNKNGEIEKPKITFLPTTTRGNSFRINFSDSSRAIKPLESKAEKDIANTVSDLGIGPKQFKTKEGFLHEEFIDGIPLLKLEKEKCTPEYMKSLGQKFIRALKKLHDNNILVNDQILTNDFNKSHMIIDKEGEVRFIDFGASVDISNFPNISDEEVLSLMRTDPFMMFRINDVLSANEEDKNIQIQGYRDHILSQFKTKEDIIQCKDMQLLGEGLCFLGQRLPNVDSFIKGIDGFLNKKEV